MAKFGEAFAAARKAGKSTFTWQGKSYTTQTKEEAAAKKSGGAKKAPSLPTPASRRPGARPPGQSQIERTKAAPKQTTTQKANEATRQRVAAKSTASDVAARNRNAHKR